MSGSSRLSGGGVLLSCMLAVLCGQFCCCSRAQGQPARTPDAAYDSLTLVIVGPAGPVLVDVQISVGNRAYRDWISGSLARVLDGDADGRLAAAELTALSPGVRAFAGISSTGDFPNGGDAGLSASEFRSWFSARIPRLLDLIAQPQPADDAVRLAALLDLNGDLSVSEQEMLAATRTLRFRDLDDDETFALAELMPYRDPLSQDAAVRPEVLSLPFLHVGDERSVADTAARLMVRYGRDGVFAAATLRMSGAIAEEQLSEDGLRTFLRAPKYHLVLKFRLSDKANLSDVEALPAPGVESFCQVEKVGRGQLMLKLDGMRMRLLARGGGANDRMMSKGYIGQEFSLADADRSQELSAEEFNAISGSLSRAGANLEFSAVDQDRSGGLSRKELFRGLDSEQAVVSGRVEMTVEQSGRTLFSILDVNRDRRLTRREIHSGHSGLRQFDLNSDGLFSELELGTEYSLSIGLGRSEYRRASEEMTMNPAMMAGAADAILPGPDDLAGPLWFRRMDRNQDGDVSLREFPGTAEQFQQLDTDSDGLISAAEAGLAGSGKPAVTGMSN